MKTPSLKLKSRDELESTLQSKMIPFNMPRFYLKSQQPREAIETNPTAYVFYIK